MEINLNTRLSAAFVLAFVGLLWQGIVAMLGGEASSALISSCSAIILATLGFGIKNDGNSGKSERSINDE